MTDYREGDSQVTVQEEMVELPIEAVSTPMETPLPVETLTPVPPEQRPEERKIVTAVLLLQYEDGRIDAVTDLPSVEKHHQASLREARNMSHSIVSDMDNLLTSKLVSQDIQMHAAKIQMQKQLEQAQKGMNMTPQQMQALVNRSLKAVPK
jgi:hypothetical protein